MERTWDFFVMGESSQITNTTTATSTYSDGNGQDFCGDMGKQAFAQSILYTDMDWTQRQSKGMQCPLTSLLTLQ